jgi:hypothetical protein
MFGGVKMNNQFNESELVLVNKKAYPVVGGRLRLAHEENTVLSIETSIIQYDREIAVIQAKVTTDKGTYNGLGNATIIRDAKLKAAILELAETRAIARALRFAGYGVEFTGAEEMPGTHTNEEEEQEREMLNKKISPESAKVIETLITARGGDINKTYKTYNIKSLEELTVAQAGELKNKLAGA